MTSASRPSGSIWRLGAAVLALLLPGPGLRAAEPAAPVGDLAVYHVGNSLTGDLWVVLSEILTDQRKSRGGTYRWQAHYRGATSLSFMFRTPEGPGTQSIGVLADYVWKDVGKPGFVPWTTALPGHHWDVVTMEPWQDDGSATLASETAAITAMIAAARKRPDNAATRFAVYAAWAEAPIDRPTAFRDTFTRPTPDQPGQRSEPTRAFFRHVTDAVRRSEPAAVMIPAGEVLLALDEKMRAGKFEKFTTVSQLHRDVIHLNSAGSNVVAWTAYAVLTGTSPVGLPNHPRSGPDYPPYRNITELSPADQRLMQETIWETVTSPELRGYTGIQPQPETAGR